LSGIEEVAEVEIETAALSRRRRKRQSRFLKGPISLAALQSAAVLPGKALAVYLCIRHRCDMTGRSTITLPASLLADFGIRRDTKARALRDLETAGLIDVARAPGRSAGITLKHE
jgi:hypothetical protein